MHGPELLDSGGAGSCSPAQAVWTQAYRVPSWSLSFPICNSDSIVLLNFSQSKAESCYLHLLRGLLEGELMHISVVVVVGHCTFTACTSPPSDACALELETPASCSPTIKAMRRM